MCIYGVSCYLFSAECIILLLYTGKYKIYFIKDICGKVLLVCGYQIKRFVTSFPAGELRCVETEGLITECNHTVCLVQTTTKSQNSQPATAWRNHDSLNNSLDTFSYFSTSFGGMLRLYFWGMVLPFQELRKFCQDKLHAQTVPQIVLYQMLRSWFVLEVCNPSKVLDLRFVFQVSAKLIPLKLTVAAEQNDWTHFTGELLDVSEL